MILEFNPARAKRKTIDFIKERSRNGAIIGYPTRDVLRAGCDLFNIKAMKTLYEMRGLDEKLALEHNLQRHQGYKQLCGASRTFRLPGLEKHASGAYTFILKARRIVPRLLMTAKKRSAA